MKENNEQNQIEVELTEEMAQGIYVNMALIANSSSEFVIDFIRVVPGIPKAKVQSRVILTPENAKRLLYALNENVKRFEKRVGSSINIENNDGFLPPINNNPIGRA